MMTTFGIITLVLGILFIVASFSFLIKDTYSFCKNSILVRLEKKEVIRYAIYAFGSAIGFTLLFLSIYLSDNRYRYSLRLLRACRRRD